MKRHRLSCGSRYNQGFSLIELMVSLVIGLIISVAAFSAYLGASRAARMAEAQGRMNEDAQAALTILTQQLRMAGNNPKQSNRTLSDLRNPVYSPATSAIIEPGTFTTSDFSVRGCDGTFSNITATTASRIDLLNCISDTAKPDSIAISYEADQYNTVRSSANLPTDCLGNLLSTITATFVPPPATTSTTAASATYAVADNRFYIGTSKVILSPSLYCKGNSGISPQPLVENIEDLQFTYGMLNTTATTTTATLAGYLDADEISALAPTPQTPNEAARWAKVVTVRICVLVRSNNPVAMDANSAKYRNCENALVSAPDLRLRRAYSTTVVLRNRRS